MTIDGSVWFIGNTGAVHSAEVARGVLYAATGGACGVVLPADMKVSASSTPNGNVNVAAGAWVSPNRYSGGAGQSYGARVVSSTAVPVDATGSGSGRTDLVIARTYDPEYPGEPAPADVATGPYWGLTVLKNQSASIRRIEQLNLTYPAVLLARLTIPASTAVITAGMITDLRVVANPQQLQYTFMDALVAADTDPQNTVAPSSERWPDAALHEIWVPAWATRAQIKATWGQVTSPAVPSGANNGYLWARVWTGSNIVTTQTVGYRKDANDSSRETFTLADTISIPAALRNAYCNFDLQAQRIAGSAAQVLSADAYSSFAMEILLEAQAE